MNNLPEDFFSLQIFFNRKKKIANISVLYISDDGILNVRKALSELFEIEMLSAQEIEVEDGFRILNFDTKNFEKIELLQQLLIHKIEMQNLISNISLN
jgi:hypothetical protein